MIQYNIGNDGYNSAYFLIALAIHAVYSSKLDNEMLPFVVHDSMEGWTGDASEVFRR